ncbi:MAG TPA: hypothetical protein VIF64_04615 [Pyrinomonadaceae bacterium]|jgi:hypothetical protein
MLSRNKIGLTFSLLCLLFVAVPATAVAQTWTTLRPAGEGFSLQLPLEPKAESSNVPILGDDYLMKMYTAVDDPNRMLYMAVMQEFPAVVASLKPAQRLDQFMNGFRNGFVKALTTSCPDVDLKLDTELTIKGRMGRQYSLDCKGVHGLIRVIENERRMYVLLVMGGDERNAGVGHFFDSFEILPAPVPVPKPVASN